MSKWADFLISDKKYKDAGNRKYIDEVFIHLDLGEKVGEGSWVTRDKVVFLIKKDITFCTIYKGDDVWKQGMPVIIDKVNDVEYLKTESNNTEKDNLEKI